MKDEEEMRISLKDAYILFICRLFNDAVKSYSEWLLRVNNEL
jgi:hypothetical protein